MKGATTITIMYLTKEEILTLHFTMMEHYDDADQSGVKEPEKLEYALERPRTTVFGEEQYPAIIEKACCYYHSIVTGHIFHNGNKRTGLLVFGVFLEINGMRLVMEEQQAEDFTVYLAVDDKFRGNDAIALLTQEISPFIKELH